MYIHCVFYWNHLSKPAFNRMTDLFSKLLHFRRKKKKPEGQGVAGWETHKVLHKSQKGQTKNTGPKNQTWSGSHWSGGGDTKCISTGQKKQISNTQPRVSPKWKTQRGKWWCRLPENTQPTEQGELQPPYIVSQLTDCSQLRESITGAPNSFCSPVTQILRNPCSHQDLGGITDLSIAHIHTRTQDAHTYCSYALRLLTLLVSEIHSLTTA